MITATITSIIQQGDSLVVIVNRSDIGNVTYTFGILDTPTSVQSVIQADVDNANALAFQLSTMQPLIGTTIQTDPSTLTTLQGNINAKNMAAAGSSAQMGAL